MGVTYFAVRATFSAWHMIERRVSFWCRCTSKTFTNENRAAVAVTTSKKVRRVR
jgi:hypothetical protein